MNLMLHLTPETEAKLREQAAQSGKSLETLALEALEEKLADGNDLSKALSDEVWKAKFDEFLANLPRSGAAIVDDSRESIYQGRGE